MNLLLLALGGCAWIGGSAHQADLAVWSVVFDAPTIVCGSQGLTLAAMTDRPDGEVLSLLVQAAGTSRTVEATVAGGRLSWGPLDLPLDSSVTSIEVRLEGVRATRDEVLELRWEGGANYYADQDGDGYGAGEPASACEAPDGYVSAAGDCDDADPHTHPGADEVCGGGDEDCSGAVDDDPVDAVDGYVDADGDGAAGTPAVACDAVTESTDCDDHDPAVSPTADEVCGGGDEDCDGLTDDDDPDLVATPGPVDADGDGHAALLEVPTCSPVTGLPQDDCDDTESSVHPGRTEVCDGVDNDCDGDADDDDEEVSFGPDHVWFPDVDQDGLGVDDNGQLAYACVAPPGYVGNHDDCDDSLASIGAPQDYYLDADGDGVYAHAGTFLCVPPEPPWALTPGGDCDDLDGAQYPGAPELCNLADDDCNGLVDDAPQPLAYDVDLDGYGDELVATTGCPSDLTGLSHQLGDCDDADPSVNPGVAESCNGNDDDCDNLVDEGAPGGFLPSGAHTALGSWQQVLDGADDLYQVCGSVGWSGLLERPLTLELAPGAVLLGRLEVSGADLTVVGGRLEPLDQGARGGAVHIQHGTLEISDAEVVCDGIGQVGQGGAFAIDGGSLVASQVSIAGCEADQGGAIWANESSVSLTAVELTGGIATTGAGLYLAGNQGLTLAGVTRFENNDAADTGGALHLQGPNTGVTVQAGADVRFVGNRAQRGGAVYSFAQQMLGVASYQDNAADQGGALYLEEGAPLIAGTFSFNEATTDGGAVYITSNAANETRVNAAFVGNHVGQLCSPAQVASCSGPGGAIATEGPLRVEAGASFTDNAATMGGALAAAGSLVIDGEGDPVTFTGNGALQGFAVSSSVGPATLNDVTFGGPGPAGAFLYLGAGTLDCEGCDTGGSTAVSFDSGAGSGPFEPALGYTCDASTETCTAL